MTQLIGTIESTLEWLKRSDDDELSWEDHISILEEDLRALSRIEGGIRRPDKTGTRSAEAPHRDAYTEKVRKGIPYVREMIDAMRRRNRDAARKQGESALTMFR